MILMDYINYFLTFLSIVASVVSIRHAKQAKQYRDAALLLCDVLNLEGLYTRFTIESKIFQDKTRGDQWYKGVEANLIISPYTEVIYKFGEIYHLIKDPEELKSKVCSLNDIVQDFEKVEYQQKKCTRTLIFEITNILQQAIVYNKRKVSS